MPAVPRKRAGGSVDQVAGDGRRAQRAVGVNGSYLARPVLQTRLSRRVLLYGVLVSRPRANGAVRAADSARSVSVHQDAAGSNWVCHCTSRPKGATLALNG